MFHVTVVSRTGAGGSGATTTRAQAIERARPVTANHRAADPDAIVRIEAPGQTDEMLMPFLDVSVDRAHRLSERLQEFVREPRATVARRVERVSTFGLFPPH
jgi:hypothetical protein